MNQKTCPCPSDFYLIQGTLVIRIMAENEIFDWEQEGSHNIYTFMRYQSAVFPVVKAMVFTVVMYGCESWTIKKTEC